MKATVTLKDIAELAGTSHVTVSRVLNNAPGTFPISDSTRKRVLECVRKLNYSPNAFARAMRLQKTDIIALVYSTDIASYVGNDSYYMSVQGGVEKILSESNCSLLVCTATNEQINEGTLPLAIKNGLVDGVLTFDFMSPNFFKAVKQKNIFLAAINCGEKTSYCDCSLQNNKAAMEVLYGRLRQWGHKKMCIVAPDEFALGCECRKDAFCSLMIDDRLELNEKLILKVDSYSEKSGEVAAEMKLQRPDITAFVCMTDGIAAEVLITLKKAGIRVPEEVTVVGSGEYVKWLQRYTNLTTVHMDANGMACDAAQMLLDRINGLQGPSMCKFSNVEFVEGGTAGPCIN